MTTSLPGATVEADGLAAPRRGLAVAAVLGAMTLVVLDAAVVNLALPSIGRSLQVAPAAAVSVVTAYQLGLVMALLPAAALGESLGFRRVFAAGVALFAGASLLCALAPSLAWLVAGRLVQGLGGAAVMSLGVALLRSVVPPDRLGAAIGWNALTVALASAAGPTLGAAILSVASWPWLFVVNLPVAAGVLIAARALPRPKGTGRPVDLRSVALNAGAFALFVVAAERAPESPLLGLTLFGGGAALLAGLIAREAGRPAPLVPLDLLRHGAFRVSAVASILCFVGQSAGLLALPFHLQHTLGLTPLAAGLVLTPWPLAVAVVGPLAGRLANRVPTAWLCLAGGVVLGGGLAAAAAWPTRDQPLALGFWTALCGLGFGLFNVPNNRNLFLSAPRERSGAAGGLQGMARLTGQTGGAIVLAVLFGLQPPDVAPRIGLALGAAMALAAGAASLLRAAAPHAGLTAAQD